MVCDVKNYLRLEGNEKEINRFVQKARGEGANFQEENPYNQPIFLRNFIPTPWELIDTYGAKITSRESDELILRYGFNCWGD